MAATTATAQRKHSIFDESDSDPDNPPTPPPAAPREEPTKKTGYQEVASSKKMGLGPSSRVQKVGNVRESKDNSKLCGGRGGRQLRKKTRLIGEEEEQCERDREKEDQIKVNSNVHSGRGGRGRGRGGGGGRQIKKTRRTVEEEEEEECEREREKEDEIEVNSRGRGARGRGRGRQIKKTRRIVEEEEEEECEREREKEDEIKVNSRGRGGGRQIKKIRRIVEEEEGEEEEEREREREREIQDQPSVLTTTTTTTPEESTCGGEEEEEEEEGEAVAEGCGRVRLTPSQRAVAEQNRQLAISRRRKRANQKSPYCGGGRETTKGEGETTKVIRINNTKLVDTGAGFFIEGDDEGQLLSKEDMLAAMHLVTDPAPFLEEEDRPVCDTCGRTFHTSYLMDNFSHPICDQCRDRDEAHTLITRTDARTEYLLKDTDLDKREPPLRFLVRANPHNAAWGDMKLYLKLQVERRALEVWGSEAALEAALERKEEQQQRNKEKKYRKKMKELRMSVRSSLYTRATKTHTHTYGEEVYMPDEDTYMRTCDSCGHSYTYDKM